MGAVLYVAEIDVFVVYIIVWTPEGVFGVTGTLTYASLYKVAYSSSSLSEDGTTKTYLLEG